MYAIVRNGGRQTKVAVGDVIEIDKLDCTQGESLSLAAVLVVDGSDVTTDADALAKVDVQAEVVGPSKGPKIHILKYKNKTGYRKRQGHRQHYTQVRVTGISTDSAGAGSGTTSATSTGPADTSAIDTGSTDTGSTDTGSTDTGSTDTGVTETGSSIETTTASGATAAG